jgi:hypothetical protein
MKKRLPSKIKVGAVIYGVTSDFSPWEDDFAQLPLGLTCHLRKAIYLNPGEVQPAAIANTLWHEITHAVLFEYGLNGAKLKEELVASVLGAAMPLLLADNPELVAWTRYAVTS